MGDLTIRTLDGVPFSQLHQSFLKAFSDYRFPVNLTPDGFRCFLERRRFDPGLSLGLWNSRQLAGFILNGSGKYGGRPTAYDCGTGILPEFRGSGAGKKLVRASLKLLRSNEIKQWLLEVLCDNEPAYKLYQSFGFSKTRTLLCYRLPDFYLSARQYHAEVKSISMESAFEVMNQIRLDYDPSWQNSQDALLQVPGCFRAAGCFMDETAAGVGIIEKATGDLALLYVRPEFRRRGIASQIVMELADLASSTPLLIKNVDASNNTAHHFLEQSGGRLFARQYEMILGLPVR